MKREKKVNRNWVMVVIESQETDILLHRNVAVVMQYGHDYLGFSFYLKFFQPQCIQEACTSIQRQKISCVREKKRVLNVL